MQKLFKPSSSISLTSSIKRFISIGDKIPNNNLKVIEYIGDKYVSTPVSTESLLSRGRYIIFGYFGAFNPTCESFQIPEYISKAEELKADGITKIMAMSVNDPFTVQAFAEKMGAKDSIDFIADGTGAFTQALGVEADLSDYQFGTRYRRFSMVVENGRVIQFNDSISVAKHNIH